MLVMQINLNEVLIILFEKRFQSPELGKNDLLDFLKLLKLKSNLQYVNLFIAQLKTNFKTYCYLICRLSLMSQEELGKFPRIMLFLRSLNYFLKGNCKIRLLHTLASNLDKFSELTLIRVALEKKLQLLYNITPLYSTSPPRHLNIMLKVFVSLSLAASITVLPERGGGEGGGGRGREICLGYLMLIHLSPSVL